jgi:hypothetical protein
MKEQSEQEFLDKTLQDAKKPPIVTKPAPVGSSMDLAVVREVLKRVAGKAMDLQAVTGQLMETVDDRGLTAEYLHGEMELVRVYNELKAIMEKEPREEKDVSRFAYFHRRGEMGMPRGMRYTVAYERTPITLQMLSLAVLNPKNLFEIRLGAAFCHTKDRFNKRIGREFAVSRIRPMSFKLTNISPAPVDAHLDEEETVRNNADRTFFTLSSATGLKGVEVHGYVYNDTSESRITHIWMPYEG